jgi:ribosomal protein S27AE
MTSGLTPEVDLTWWEQQSRACPRCQGPGRLLVIEITDVSTREAVRQGLACLGDCCIDGLAPDRQCVRCGLRF